MKQVLLVLVVLCIGTCVYAASVDREKTDFFEDIKCSLSNASDKIKDSVSSVGTSLKDGTSKAFDVISDVAVKTGSAIRDGLSVAVETGKSGLEVVRDAIKGKQAPEIQDIESIIDVRSGNINEP